MDGPWHLDPLHIVLRLGLSLLLGGVIGIERERSNHAAGFRTHILVCLGSTLIMLLSAYGFSAFANEVNVRMDPARLAAQVVSGIGFLGAGVILRNGISITGLTTAASLWVVAAIGLAAGAGFYIGAVVTTVFVLFNLLVLNKVEKRWFSVQKKYTLKLRAAASFPGMVELTDQLDRKNIKIIGLKSSKPSDQKDHEQQADQVLYALVLQVSKSEILPALIERLRNMPGVSEVQIS